MHRVPSDSTSTPARPASSGRARRRHAPALLVAAALVLGPGWGAADPSDAPLVLTVEDLERVAAKRTPGIPIAAGAPSNAFTRVEGRAPSPRPPGSGAAADPAADDDADRVAPSWREEYFRLKAIALRQAIERGDPVSFEDARGETDASDPAAASDDPSADARSAARPACVYDRDGRLLHAPPGRRCRASQAAPAERPTAHRRMCIYGIRGEVLHAPAGRDCDAP